MKKGIIIYQSKYGATKKYVSWLHEMTGFDCVKTRRVDPAEAAQYETVILCGGIYASGIAGLSFLKKHIGKLRGKRIAIFCVGASPYDAAAFEQVRAHNLQGDLEDIPLFYGRGAWDEDRMTWIDRTLCRALWKSVEKKDPDTYKPWMDALICAAGQTCDWTDRAYLKPVLEYLGISENRQGEL